MFAVKFWSHLLSLLGRNGESIVEVEELPIVEEPEVALEQVPDELLDFGKFDVRETQLTQFMLSKQIEDLQLLLEGDVGVDQARVSFKTTKGGEQYLDIVIYSRRPKFRHRQKSKFERRLKNLVVPRVDLPEKQIRVKVQRVPKEMDVS